MLKNIVIGGRELINLQDFINDLYTVYNLKLNDYILIDNANNLKNNIKITTTNTSVTLEN